jgi:predicted XRE-type DNA-binding protein
MNPVDIKAAIARAGTSQAAIALYLGVSTTAVCKVVNGTARSARVEKEIEKIAGKGAFGAKRPAHRTKTVWTGQVAQRAGSTA